MFECFQLLDEEEATGDGNTTSPGSDEDKRLAEVVKVTALN